MTAEQTAAAARDYNDRAAAAVGEAERLRSERDNLVMQLRADHGWSYGQIAKSVGLSRGMVAMICRPLARP